MLTTETMTLGQIIDFKVKHEKNFREKLLEMDVFFQNHMWDGYSDDNGQFISESDFVALQALSDKIYHMVFNIGCPLSVPEMLNSICDRKIKYWASHWSDDHGKQLKTKSDRAKVITDGKYKYQRKYNKIMVDKGHFRWNRKGYTLSRVATDLLRFYTINNDLFEL